MPLPVLASPITSRPASTSGIALAWIGVGFLNCSARHASHSGSITPSSSNVSGSGSSAVSGDASLGFSSAAMLQTATKKLAVAGWVATSTCTCQHGHRQRPPSGETLLPTMPWDQWRHDFNAKVDRYGENQMNKVFKGRASSGTYQERVARARQGNTGGPTDGKRSMPPPPPGMSGAGAGVPPPPPPQRGPVPAPPPRGGSAAAPAGDALHIQFSRFTEDDKQAFFQLLDEVRATATGRALTRQYFGNTTHQVGARAAARS